MVRSVSLKRQKQETGERWDVDLGVASYEIEIGEFGYSFAIVRRNG